MENFTFIFTLLLIIDNVKSEFPFLRCFLITIVKESEEALEEDLKCPCLSGASTRPGHSQNLQSLLR